MKNEFLEQLAQLCETHRAEFYYTTDDDGIHVRLGDEDSEDILIGHVCHDDVGVKIRAAKDPEPDAPTISDYIICCYPSGEFVVDDEKWPLILAERKRLGRMLDIDDLKKLFKA